MDKRLPRKLVAILYADVAGYSRLTGQDEDDTHRRLRESPGGRTVHYAGAQGGSVSALTGRDTG